MKLSTFNLSLFKRCLLPFEEIIEEKLVLFACGNAVFLWRYEIRRVLGLRDKSVLQK